MPLLTAQGTRAYVLTKRGLYFFILWIPPLIVDCATWYGFVVHIPFALVHSVFSRRKSTPELLRASWKVPVKVAGFALLQGLGFQAYDRQEMHNWSDLTWFSVWDGFLAYVGIAFGVAFVHLCLGWFLLVTLAHRWPNDNRVADSAKLAGPSVAGESSAQ
jgi:hypothetical protein